MIGSMCRVRNRQCVLGRSDDQARKGTTISRSFIEPLNIIGFLCEIFQKFRLSFSCPNLGSQMDELGNWNRQFNDHVLRLFAQSKPIVPSTNEFGGNWRLWKFTFHAFSIWRCYVFILRRLIYGFL